MMKSRDRAALGIQSRATDVSPGDQQPSSGGDMSVRRTVVAASMLALVFIAGASAKKPQPPPPPPPPPSEESPTAPTNLRLTVNGPYSITLAWDASKTSSSNWWYCIQRDGQGCIRVDPPQTAFTFSR